MDKSDHNTNTSVGAAMAKATEVKEAEVNEDTEDIIATMDIEDDVQAPPWEEYILEVGDEVPVMYHGIAIYGSQLVSAKFLEVVKHVLMSDDFHKEEIVDSIVFAENMPTEQDGTPIFACYKPSLKQIGINLQHHFDGAVQLVKEVDGHMSIRGHLWYNMVLSLLHEMFHGLFIATDAEGDMADMLEIEETCKDMADEALTKLVLEFEIEPPSMAEEPFFGSRYMQFFIREIQNGDASWCKRQTALHDDMNIHYDDGRDEYIQLFRSFIRATHGEDERRKDPRWDVAPRPLEVAPDDEAMAQILDPDPLGPTDKIIPSDGRTVEQLEQAIAVEHAAQPAIATPMGEFHGMDEEAIAMMALDEEMGGESNAYVMEDYDTLPAEAAGTDLSAGPPVVREQVAHVDIATATEPVVTAAPTAGTFCSNCGGVTTAAMKFCSGCGQAQAAIVPPVVQNLVTTQQPYVAPQTHRGAPGQILRTGLENHNWTAEQFRHIVERIMFRAYAHLFNKCGYNIMSKPAFDDTLKWGVLEPVFVGDACESDEVSRVLLGHDIVENNINRINVPIADGFIRGFVTKGGMLPCYTLYFNANGKEIKRVLLPTNPWKEKIVGVYSKPAMRAQAGAIIAWIMDGDDNAQDKWRGRIENSVFYWS